MRIYQVHKSLWRIVRGEIIKDVFVDGDKIVEPNNPHNILSTSERLAIENKLKT